jgi:uncharacterized DUF497 family protein
MEYEWDDEKAKLNKAKHGVVFDAAHLFQFGSAKIIVDDRKDYGEERLIGLGLIGERVFVIVFTERGSARRVITLRKANKREIKSYVEYLEKSTQAHAQGGWDEGVS